ncbi:MAG: hypothetical protein KGD63_11530 [Candidatus Lokiarchaeota archaeon]|nr:hypothetical protein [Candidatus Lokiarchaeota archaeon]
MYKDFDFLNRKDVMEEVGIILSVGLYKIFGAKEGYIFNKIQMFLKNDFGLRS